MKTENQCPHCGKPIPPTALGGICPECMLKAGVAETGEVGPEGTVTPTPPRPAPSVPELAPHVPQLEILECLGRGGMGVVYKARQPKLDRFVALKILSRKHGSNVTDAEFAERFQREARALARLNHPAIVAVYDFGEVGTAARLSAPAAGTLAGETPAPLPLPLHYLLMEFVDGLTLRQLLQTRKLSPEEALTIVPKICQALQFAHEHGIVHRDIKPENILLDRLGRVKIADFGIAKIVEATAGRTALTGAKDVLGTPHYMAPEQLEKPSTVDHRADIFSLGVVFYEMLTGELPLGKFQPPSRKVQVDVRLDEVVLHALEKEPDRRYQHASEVKTDVEKIAASPEGRASSGEPAAARDAIWFSTNLLPELLAGERILHCEQRLRVVFNKSLPAYRFFFSLPPLWSAGLYLTDRRVLFVSHFFGLAQKFSLWFPGKAPDAQRELLQATSTGVSRVLGAYLQFNSVDFKPRWYRGRELRLRIYLRQPEILRDQIVAAQSAALPVTPAGGNSRRAIDSAPTPSGWVLAARWMARLFSVLLLAFYGFFILGEGLPPIGSQPGGVQLNFAALGLMFLGFVIGWKREGAAALLIALGWTVWHVSEGRLRWNVFQTPLPVAGLYGFCWWATRGRKTAAVAGVIAGLALLLGLGRLFVPASVTVSGEVVDALTHQPVPGAEMRLLPRPMHVVEKGDPPNARGNGQGRFNLYVGWYAEADEVEISAPGYGKLTTKLGPRPLGARRVRRDFQLQRETGVSVESQVPPVVIETFPPAGTADVDPAITELRVTFSKPMRDRSWSWTTWGEENFPQTVGPPRLLADGRTCVLPVKLKPGKLYATWLNSEFHKDFTDTAGQPAVPYLLIFQTRK